jgi:sugar/nucleoside kinase (ribokinase family)
VVSTTKLYDIAFLGHYTRDTIVSSSSTRVVDGGAFNYGAHVAGRMGLEVAAVTRLAREDFDVVDELRRLGVDVFARVTPRSTCLRLEYPTSDVDQRVITVTSTAGPFTPEEVEGLQARAFVIGASMRGEVSLAVIEELARVETFIAADVQGFVRVARAGRLAYEAWPEKRIVLAHVDMLKTDAVEAHMLTGTADVRVAARMLAALGPSEIVLTHRDGVLVYAGDQFYEAGFFPHKLVGRSGRGDTCIAAYVARRLTGSPAEATVWAAAVTSLKMESEGPFRRDLREAEELMRSRYSG